MRALFARAACVLLSTYSAAALAGEPADQPVSASQPAGRTPASQPAGAASPSPASAPVAPRPAPKAEAPIELPIIEETTVVARRPMTAASSETIRDRDFLLRPHLRPADILMVTPGLFGVQHAGGGKANQYFLRGFDADHGTDVLIMVDGVPVNMVSHGHGQGYADLHFVIPEAVERIEVAKGPYFAEYGDFATAGAFNLVTRAGATESAVSFTGGHFSTLRGVLMASPDLGEWKPFLAAEVYGTNGPFENAEELTRYNLFAKLGHTVGPGQLSAAFTAYSAGWNASGQIPEREVLAGRLGRFGSIDDSEGGSTQRYGLYATYTAATAAGDVVKLLGYAHQYRFKLFSNFTFFSRDPVNGDEIEQADDRSVAGLKGSYRFSRKLGATAFHTTFGLETRRDTIANGLFDVRDRERLAAAVDADISETALAVFATEEIVPSRRLRAVLGVRGDYFNFDVTDNLEDQATLGDRTSGIAQAALLSPKASLILSPHETTELYLNFGMGYHSNDARGVVRAIDPVTPLSRALGYEVGARARLFGKLDLAAAGFGIKLGSETVWVGDEGTTEESDPTLRYGAELEGRYELTPWLFADLDATLTHGEFTGNGGNASAIALAPTFVLQGGLSVRHPAGITGRLGVFHIGDRPATEDRFLTAEGFTRIDLNAGYRVGRVELAIDVQNLTNTQWREAQFATVSRLAGEISPASCPASTRAVEDSGAFVGCEDVNFTPGAPFNTQVTATIYF
jgi:outer membrane receptor protein involved in Fe transport